MSSTVIQTVIHRHPRGGGGDMTFTDFTDVTDYFTDFYWFTILLTFTDFTDLVTRDILMTSYFRTSLINKIMF